jgi:hypothetical protein
MVTPANPKHRLSPSGPKLSDEPQASFFYVDNVEFNYSFTNDPDESQSTREDTRLVWPLPPTADPESLWRVVANPIPVGDSRPAWMDNFSISHVRIEGYTTVFPDVNNSDIPPGGAPAALVVLGLSLLKDIIPPIARRGLYTFNPDPIPAIIATPGLVSGGSELVAFPEANIGDAVLITNNGAQQGLVFEGQVSAPGQVTFYVMNFNAAPFAVPPGGFDLTIEVVPVAPPTNADNVTANVPVDLIFFKKGTPLNLVVPFIPPP